MTTPLPRLPMTKAIRTLYTERFAESGMPVGLGAIPTVENPNPQAPAHEKLIPVKPPYWILHPLWSNTSGPPMGDPDADAEWIYQLSAYAARGDQIEWMLDRARETWVGRNPDRTFRHPLAVDGMHVMDRTLGTDIGADPGSGTNGVLQVAIKVTPDYP